MPQVQSAARELVDPATEDFNEGCILGYRNESILCSACEHGFSQHGLHGQCKRCPEKYVNYGLLSALVFVFIIGIMVYIKITLSDGGKIDAADGVKIILMSYLQMMSLLANFPIYWPEVFVTLFRIGTAVAAFGNHVVDVKCLVEDYLSEADVFFTSRIVWAASPVILSLSCFLFWRALWLCCASRWKRKDPEYGHKLSRDMKASSVALLFLLHPTLCEETFSIFSCRTICSQSRLLADMNEPCWEGRHATYIYAIGAPMILIHVIGLPAAVWFSVLRLQRLQRKPHENLTKRERLLISNESFVFGMFYDSYRRETHWWWEIIVITSRKVTIAAIAVFGTNMGSMQVHLSSAVIILLLLLTVSIRPFKKDRWHLQVLETMSLTMTWMFLWAGTVFYSYPRCESHGHAALHSTIDDPDMSAKNAYNGSQTLAFPSTLFWCDAISVLIGILGFSLILLLCGCYIYLKVCSLHRSSFVEKTKTKNAKVAKDAKDVQADSGSEEVYMTSRAGRELSLLVSPDQEGPRLGTQKLVSIPSSEVCI